MSPHSIISARNTESHMSDAPLGTIVTWKGIPYKLPTSIFYGSTLQDRPEKHVVLLQLGSALIVVMDAEKLRKTNSSRPIVLDCEANRDLVREVVPEQGIQGMITFP